MTAPITVHNIRIAPTEDDNGPKSGLNTLNQRMKHRGEKETENASREANRELIRPSDFSSGEKDTQDESRQQRKRHPSRTGEPHRPRLLDFRT